MIPVFTIIILLDLSFECIIIRNPAFGSKNLLYESVSWIWQEKKRALETSKNEQTPQVSHKFLLFVENRNCVIESKLWLACMSLRP